MKKCPERQEYLYLLVAVAILPEFQHLGKKQNMF